MQVNHILQVSQSRGAGSGVETYSADLCRENKTLRLKNPPTWVKNYDSTERETGPTRGRTSEISTTVESLLGKGEVFIKSFVLEESHMFLNIVSNEIWDSESGLKAGIMIGNSEVGMGSVSVEPFAFRKP